MLMWVYMCVSVCMSIVSVHVFAADHKDTVRKEVSITLFQTNLLQNKNCDESSSKKGQVNSDRYTVTTISSYISICDFSRDLKQNDNKKKKC